MNGSKNKFMELAIALSEKSVAEGGGPFGAVVVRRGEVVATGTNSVTLLNDPTAHAEVSAIRAACAAVKDFKLEECEIYSSCEPCPMCLSAIYWAGIRKIYFANTREDAKRIGFDDSFIYDQIPLAPSRRTVPSEEMMRAEALQAFRLWERKEDKVEYLTCDGCRCTESVSGTQERTVYGRPQRWWASVRPSGLRLGTRLRRCRLGGSGRRRFWPAEIWPRGKFLLSLPRCKVREGFALLITD